MTVLISGVRGQKSSQSLTALRSEGVSRRDITNELRDRVTLCQWRSYTRAHTGPGPGEFLSALVNNVKSTEPVYRIMSRAIKQPMPLTYGFSFFVRQLQQQIYMRPRCKLCSFKTNQLRSKFTLLIMKRQCTLFDNVLSLWTLKVPTSARL